MFNFSSIQYTPVCVGSKQVSMSAQSSFVKDIRHESNAAIITDGCIALTG